MKLATFSLSTLFLGTLLNSSPATAYRDPTGEEAPYRIDRTLSRTSAQIRGGHLFAKVTGGREDPEEGRVYDVDLEYELRLVARTHSGTSTIAIPEIYFSADFLTDLRRNGAYEAPHFKVRHMGMGSVRTMSGRVYENCDKILIFDVDTGRKGTDDSTAAIRDLEINAYIHPSVPVLGAATLDIHAMVDGISMRVGGDYSPTNKSQDILTVKTAALGSEHTCTLLSNNKVKCWGNNTYGQLGVGDRNPRGDTPGTMGDALPYVDLGTDEPVRDLVAGDNLTCALFESGRTKCWGQKAARLFPTNPSYFDVGGEPNEMGTNLPFVEFGNNQTIVAMDSDPELICLASSAGKLKCLTTDSTPRPVASVMPFGFGGERVNDVTTERVYSNNQLQVCATFESGKVACFGGTNYYQAHGGGEQFVPDIYMNWPPLEPDQSRVVGIRFPTTEKVRTVTFGNIFKCALFEDSRVNCWGSNQVGRLGNGLGEGEVAAVDSERVDFGTSEAIETIAGAGGTSTCVLFKNGRVKCWGGNVLGQLGLGDTKNRGISPGEMGSNLPYLDLGSVRVTKLFSGFMHNCAVFSNGGLKCWGANTYGQLGTEDTVNRGITPADMGNGLSFVRIWD